MQVPDFGSAHPGTPSEGPSSWQHAVVHTGDRAGTLYPRPSPALMFERSGLISVTDHLGHLILLFLGFKFPLLCLNSPTKRDPWKTSPLPPQGKQDPGPSLSAGNLGLPVWPGLLCNFKVPSVENLCVLKVPPRLLPKASCNHSQKQQEWCSHSTGEWRPETHTEHIFTGIFCLHLDLFYVFG